MPWWNAVDFIFAHFYVIYLQLVAILFAA